MMKPKDFGTCLNHLDASDLLEQLKQWLQIQDDGAYQKWKEEEFDINHRFVFDPSGQDNINKLTLLSIAVKYSNEKVVQALLEAGADPKEAKRELIGIVTQQAINKARKVGSICSAIVMIGAICCVMTTYAVILGTLLTADISILGAAIIAPAVVAGLVGGIITYAISKPSENLDRANAVIKKIISDCESKGLLKGYINEQSLNTNKSIITGAICGAIVMIGAICGAVAAFTILTGSGLDGVGLSILTFIGVAIVAVVTGLVARSITYAISKPSENLDSANVEQEVGKGVNITA